ncbi:MAG: pyrroline-5-carboxylate reductase [Nitrospiraceae bacterium]
MTFQKRIAFVGGGQMAEALIGGLLAARVCEAGALWATDPSADRRDLLKRRFALRVGTDNLEAAGWAEILVLAVKPQILDSVLQHLASVLSHQQMISIAAGIPIAWIVNRGPASVRVVRAMPNAPALVREGMTALAFGPGIQENDIQAARTLFEAVGRVVPIEERLLDAVTGLSGSGPAYIFMAIEALADGGVKMGLPRSTAELLAAQTMLGAARMCLETGHHPAHLKDRVTSPGGTTIAGLHALETGGLRSSLIAAVEAATIRSQELGR